MTAEEEFKSDICSVVRVVKSILEKYKEMRNEE